ncbi:hypothetical protein L1049_023828 [Liquidambar formosana]|uniref:Uncharacterized protein n=1 Tax=Liquidambar formosana TaxID=63359 RepID=A0AAP0RU46_LIQFO
MHTDLKGGMYWGDKGIDYWDAAMWKEELGKPEDAMKVKISSFLFFSYHFSTIHQKGTLGEEWDKGLTSMNETNFVAMLSTLVKLYNRCDIVIWQNCMLVEIYDLLRYLISIIRFFIF